MNWDCGGSASKAETQFVSRMEMGKTEVAMCLLRGPRGYPEWSEGCGLDVLSHASEIGSRVGKRGTRGWRGSLGNLFRALRVLTWICSGPRLEASEFV